MLPSRFNTGMRSLYVLDVLSENDEPLVVPAEKLPPNVPVAVGLPPFMPKVPLQEIPAVSVCEDDCPILTEMEVEPLSVVGTAASIKMSPLPTSSIEVVYEERKLP